MRIFFSFILLITLASCNFAASEKPVEGQNGMVVSASEHASKAGIEMLKKGGNAIDAAVATGFALAVTYPQAGNIGGGGFMVIHLADGSNTTIDFREKAPLNANKDMFLNEKGEYVPELSRESILASGVPGSVAGLIDALEKYGTLSLEEVLAPAIKLAEEGFVLDRYMAESLNSKTKDFKKHKSSAKVFTKEEGSFNPGDLFIQIDLANTLKLISENGKAGFYEGETADRIVAAFSEMNGLVTHEDLQKYKSVEREPVYGFYNGFKVVSMGPPSSGGIAVIQSLNILENFDFRPEEWNGSRYLHHLVETWKYVYADRAQHLGDKDFYRVPQDWLLSRSYGKEIARKIGEKAVPSDSIYAGRPVFNESDQTTHYSVYDKDGNAVSTTVTLNSSYGNKIVVEGAGFLLNNEMDDFSAKPGTPNQFGLLGSEANSIEPEKRMLSSMSPVIVLQDDKPLLVVGSPGGSTIITSVFQVIMNKLTFGMELNDAVNKPRIHHQWKPDKIEYEEFGMPVDVAKNLLDLGHKFGVTRTLGRVQAIYIDPSNGNIEGVSDSRSNGKAVGY